MTCILYSGSKQVARLDVGERDQAPRSVVWGEREFKCESAVYREVVAQIGGSAVPAAANNAREKDEVAGGL